MDGVVRLGVNVEYSVVIPVFNEAEVLQTLVTRVTGVLEALSSSWEIVFVNDGSSDDSLAQLRQFQTEDQRIKIISFSRNFGHQAAITAGMDYASGEAVIIMDADLQDPPEVIPELVARWREGFEVVYAIRAQREGETWFKRCTASLFYRFVRRITNIDIPLDVGDFRLIGRRALEPLRAMRETHRFVRGMVSWIGFPQTGVSYTRAPRFAGKTKYPLRKMIAFALDGVTSFSTLPLQLSSYAGVLAICLGAGYLLYNTFAQLCHWDILSMLNEHIVAALLIVCGVQLVIFGFLGACVGRIYDEVRRRPLYIVAETIGITPGIAIGERETKPNA